MRRAIIEFAILGVAYVAVLTGCSLMAGLVLGAAMRPASPARPVETGLPVPPTATQAVAPATAVPIPIMTFTPRPSATLPPAPTPTPAGGACPVVHVVVAGDTVLGLAQRYGVTEDAIVQANSLQTTASLKIGQQLIIPTCPTATPSP